MDRYCCQCDRYVMSKTAWPDWKGGYVWTAPVPGCSAEGNESKRTVADDPPCDTATFEVMEEANQPATDCIWIGSDGKCTLGWHTADLEENIIWDGVCDEYCPQYEGRKDKEE